jgi:hypothetical protein
LRRKNYDLGKDGKFPPEYAHIIGVPFKMFKGGETTVINPPDYKRVFAIASREAEFEITFPNVVGYRAETGDAPLSADFSGIENYEIDGSKFPIETEMASAFSSDRQKMKVRTVLEKRDQEIIYLITKELINLNYSDDGGKPHFHRFNGLKRIVTDWYETKVQLIGIDDTIYKKLLYFDDPKKICGHIARGINSKTVGTDKILPVFNYYNKFGSTKYVQGNTSREVYKTTKSHVNFVVADTESWEQIAAKTLEEMPEVISYVKNAFLGFSIPYVLGAEDKQYFPDFIARCRVDKEKMINLIIEITGMAKEKAEKKWYLENRWLPAVNAMREKYEYDEWRFIEIAQDIRDIKNQLKNKIHSTVKN